MSPLRCLKKYLAVARLEHTYSLRYRANTLFYISAVAVPVLLQYFLWTTLYRSRSHFGAYDLADMLTYYVITVFLNQLRIVAWWEIANSIRSGAVVHYLVRPWNHFTLYLTRTLAWSSTSWMVLLVAYVPIWGLLRHHLHPPASWHALGGLLLLWFLGGLFMFSLEYMANLLAFWTERARGFLSLLEFVRWFLGGALVPLDLLPGGRWLAQQPLAYLGYLPAQVYLGRVQGEALLRALGTILLWLGILVPLAQGMFRWGLRRYQPPGG